MQVDFDREEAWWNEKAGSEEVDLDDEAINRGLRWREIERLLPGVHSILEIGGATGAFSIPLAKRGYDVTHVDFSADRLRIARERAQGIESMRFVQANAADLAQFDDQAFDLVLNMDGAISFSGSAAKKVLCESCRLAAKKLLVTVSNRAWMVRLCISASLSEFGRFTPAVYAMLDHGQWHYDQFPENAHLAGRYLGPIQAFLPAELRQIIEEMGLRVLRCGGLGSLANLCPPETLQQITADEALLAEFLDLCERFDAEMLLGGPGTKQRAGLIAVAERAL